MLIIAISIASSKQQKCHQNEHFNYDELDRKKLNCIDNTMLAFANRATYLIEILSF